MVADFKDEISPQLLEQLAAELGHAWPGFPTAGFVADACDGLAALELMARVKHVSAALSRSMPADFATAAGVLHQACGSATFTGWMTLPCGQYVADSGIDEPELALPVLAALTPRFSSEFPIRAFIERHPALTFAHLDRWAGDADPHVRRLVSEGTRPRLPWAPLLRGFIADPTPTLALLDRLHDDESEYVRRSVANHLNDISKDHPEIAVQTARRWQATGTAGAAWVVRHGLRTLVKKGHPDALRLLGYDAPSSVRLTGLKVSPDTLPIGEQVIIAFTLTADTLSPVIIDYAVHHAGARGARSAKVFKLSNRILRPGKPLAVTRIHRFREVTVRRLHPGPHRIDIQVNGHTLASTSVLLHR